MARAIRNANPNSDNFYEDPYLTIYDLCMPVKLDVNLSLEPLLQHLLYEGRQWWNQCVLPLEVEAEMAICIARSCFYARSALAVQPYRSFFPIVTLDPETLDVCYTFHHRTGTIVSELLSLQTPQGWTKFVEAACGIFNWSFKAAGMDTSRSCNYTFLELDQAGASANHFVVLKLDLILDRRTNPQGRSTLVEKFSLFSSASDANAAIAPALTSNDAMFTTFLHSSLRRVALEASIARPEPERRKPRTDPGSFTAKECSTQPKIARYPKDTNEYYILNNPRFLVLQGTAPPSDMPPFEIPQTLVCKDVWTHSLEHCDGAILAPLRGEFGIPDVWGYVYVEDNQQLLAETLDLRRWEALEESHDDIPPIELKGERHHVRTFYSTVGEDIGTCTSPRELVTVLMHAALGHWNLFQSGWLHCDVSNSNVLKIPHPKRAPVTIFPCTRDWTDCCGVLIDTDLSVKVDPHSVIIDTKSQTDKEIPGTLPFMSVRVVDGLLYGKSVARTVWDDLESFAWILLWEYLFRGKARDCLTDHEQHILKNLASDDCRLVRAAKVEMTCYRFSCNVGLSFMPLITKWIACVEPKAAPESWRSVYEEFFDIAVQSLNEAQDWDSWDEFFTRKQNT